jgi:hypothetical protein
VVTGVDHLIHMSAAFYLVPLTSFLVFFLISDTVNGIQTRHIIIKIYFHLLYLLTCTSVFVSSSKKKTIPSVSATLKVLLIFCVIKSSIKYC